MELRNEIAHHHPRPTIKKFLGNEYIRSGADSLRSVLEKEVKDSSIPDPLFPDFYDFFLRWLRTRTKPLAIILQLTEMATIYPAVIDNAIDVLHVTK